MSKIRRKMPVSLRAKQFSPFAALKGFEEETRKREKLFENRAFLSEDRFSELNFTLYDLEPGDKIAVTFYHDGQYKIRRGEFQFADIKKRRLLFGNEEAAFDDIKEIKKEG